MILRPQRRREPLRWRDGELKSATDYERRSPADRERPEQGTDGQEDLIEAAALRPVEPVCPVHLKLRPEDLIELILEGDVGAPCRTQCVRVSGRFDEAGVGLDVEVAKAFPGGKRRRDDKGVMG